MEHSGISIETKVLCLINPERVESIFTNKLEEEVPVEYLRDDQVSRIEAAITSDFWMIPVGGDIYRVYSFDSGEIDVYFTDMRETRCTCPDFQFRNKEKGKFSCKHQWRVQVLSGMGLIKENWENILSECTYDIELSQTVHDQFLQLVYILNKYYSFTGSDERIKRIRSLSWI